MEKTLSEQENVAAMLMRLRALGVEDARILQVLEAVPRYIFFDPKERLNMYRPLVLPIACGGICETIDELAQSLQYLELKPQHRILEIGCGSGYSSAVLSYLVDKVIAIDRFKTHIEHALNCHRRLELQNIVLRHADGFEGVKDEGTFDRIISFASFDQMPRQYTETLVPGGIMLAPLSLGNGDAKMMKLTKVGSRFEREDLFTMIDSPMQAGCARAL